MGLDSGMTNLVTPKKALVSVIVVKDEIASVYHQFTKEMYLG